VLLVFGVPAFCGSYFTYFRIIVGGFTCFCFIPSPLADKFHYAFDIILFVCHRFIDCGSKIRFPPNSHTSLVMMIIWPPIL
jgi:hypothetical protein